MKRISLLVVLAVALAAEGSGLRADAQSNDNAAIGALYQQFANAFRHKDLNGIMLPYVHNNTLFVFDVTTPREHVGWDDYRADWKGFFDSIKGNPTFSIGELCCVKGGIIMANASKLPQTGAIMDSCLTEIQKDMALTKIGNARGKPKQVKAAPVKQNLARRK